MHTKIHRSISVLFLSGLAACGVPQAEDATATPSLDELGQIQSSLTPAQQRSRCDAIKSVTAAKGITNPLVYAGVAFQETRLAHCWSEATWACQGPFSAECGGPVISGAGDGPCSLRQGGLGMYQFDAGTHAQTLAMHGAGILTSRGNIDKGADFIIYKVRNCPNGPGATSDAAAIAWINSARPGTLNFDRFMAIMAWCYNGCAPTSTSCDHTKTKQAYINSTNTLLTTFGSSYWFGGSPPPTSPVIVDDQSTGCTRSGPAAGWVEAAIGHAGHMWSTTVNGAVKSNFATWKPTLPGAGTYDVSVYIPNNYATSQAAKYRIRHQGVDDFATVNQNNFNNVWVPLGAYAFSGDGSEFVELADNTGEAASTARKVGVDAVQFAKR